MIHDMITHADRYARLHPFFAQAFAWLADPLNRALACGRYQLLQDDLVAIVDEGNTGDPFNKRFESHRRYIDIQVNLSGGEIMEWTPIAGLAVADPYRTENDIMFYHAPIIPITRLAVLPDHFTVFFPNDAHKPCCHLAGVPTPFRKIVFKVAVSGLVN